MKRGKGIFKSFLRQKTKNHSMFNIQPQSPLKVQSTEMISRHLAEHTEVLTAGLTAAAVSGALQRCFHCKFF